MFLSWSTTNVDGINGGGCQDYRRNDGSQTIAPLADDHRLGRVRLLIRHCGCMDWPLLSRRGLPCHSFGLNRFKFSQDRGLIAQDGQQVEAIEPQRGVVDHHHHAGVPIKERLESWRCRHKRIG